MLIDLCYHIIASEMGTKLNFTRYYNSERLSEQCDLIYSIILLQPDMKITELCFSKNYQEGWH